MGTAIQFRKCLATPIRIIVNLNSLFRKSIRNLFHTNHRRHKLKNGGHSTIKAIKKLTNLYYRIGLVVSILLVSTISVEVSGFNEFHDSQTRNNKYSLSMYTSNNMSTHSISRQARSPSRTPAESRGYTRKLLNNSSEQFSGSNNLSSTEYLGKSGCSICADRATRINFTLDALKAEILEKLGFKSPPNTTGIRIPNIPPLSTILQQHRGNPQTPGMLGDQPLTFRSGAGYQEEDDNYLVKTEKILLLPQHLKLRHSFRDNVLQFKFSDKVTKNDIDRANLHFWLRGLESDEDNVPVNVSLFVVSRKSPDGDNRDNRDIRDNNLVAVPSYTVKRWRSKSSDGEWCVIEISTTVLSWFKSPRSNFGLIIRATPIDADTHSGRQLVPTDITDEQFTPFLEVYTKEKEKHRKKRDVGQLTCDEKSAEPNCCRYPLTVDFESFGWSFVIAPKRYEAYYCSGECPFVYKPAYMHTHVQQLAAPHHGPCCSAKKLSSLSMLYFDDSQSIIFGVLPGMVVDKCGCS